MTKKAKTILWSVISAAAALTFVGVYVFRHKKTAAPAKPAVPLAPTTTSTSVTTPQQIVTAMVDNLNLRSGAAASTPSLLTVPNHTYLGVLQGTYPDADGKKDANGKVYQWAYVKPDDILGIADNVYVRTDLVMIS